VSELQNDSGRSGNVNTDVDSLESIHGGAQREYCANYKLLCGCVSDCLDISHDVLFQGHCLLSIPYNIFPHTFCVFIQLRTPALRLIVRSCLDVPIFATRRLHACHHASAEGGTVGEKCPVIFV
jgi:hypothetical protein